MRKGRMNRRDFMKNVSANAALGGGALMLAAQIADGGTPKELPPQT